MLKFTKDYKFAHGGIKVEYFKAGQIVEKPSAELTETALADEAAIDPEAEEPAEKPEKKPAKTKA